MSDNVRTLETGNASFSDCECSGVDVSPPKRNASSFSIQGVKGGLPDKARIYPGTGVIQVGAEWWDSLNNVQRAGVLAHELAHEEDPTERCESCVDMRAGAILRHQGFSRQAVIDSLNNTVESRRAGDDAGRGWSAADEAIAAGTDGGRSIDQSLATDEQLAELGAPPPKQAPGGVKLPTLPGPVSDFFATNTGRVVVALAVAVVAALIARALLVKRS